MATRYTDPNEKNFTTLPDFVVRQQKPTLAQLMGGFLLVVFISFAIILTSEGMLLTVLLLFAVFSFLGVYMIFQVQRNRDQALTAEFQNSIFASALDCGSVFCLVAKNDGNIAYINRSFQSMFPAFLKESHLSIANLLKHGKLESSQRQKIINAVQNNTDGKAVCTMQSSDGGIHKLVLSVEPLARPSGFALIRAREFVEERNYTEEDNLTAIPLLLNRSNLVLMSYVMNRLYTGMYVTNLKGCILYTNEAMDQFLAYKEGEIAAENTPINELLYQDSSAPWSLAPDDFEGAVTLRKKGGGLVEAHIHQRIVRNPDGKILGCLGLMSSVLEHDNSLMKSIW